MIVREASDDDLDAVLAVERQAFGGDVEADLVRALMADPTAEPRLSLVAFRDGKAVGHVLVTAAKVSDSDLPVAILAPLAVIPGEQRKGYGSRLVETGLQRMAEAGVALVFVLGDPRYYSRFGFVPALRLGFTPPFPLPADQEYAWMVRALRENAIGVAPAAVRCAEALSRPEYWRE